MGCDQDKFKKYTHGFYIELFKVLGCIKLQKVLKSLNDVKIEGETAEGDGDDEYA